MYVFYFVCMYIHIYVGSGILLVYSGRGGMYVCTLATTHVIRPKGRNKRGELIPPSLSISSKYYPRPRPTKPHLGSYLPTAQPQLPMKAFKALPAQLKKARLDYDNVNDGKCLH